MPSRLQGRLNGQVRQNNLNIVREENVHRLVTCVISSEFNTVTEESTLFFLVCMFMLLVRCSSLDIHKIITHLYVIMGVGSY